MHFELRHPHEEGRRQGWSNVDTDLRDFIGNVVNEVATELKSVGFVGAYLHGSLAMNSFYRPKSDLDILFVVEKHLPPEVKRSTALKICDLSDLRPIIGDLEISVLTLENTVNFSHPMNYELHYGETHKDAIRAGKANFEEETDADLSAHLTVIGQRGLCLTGEPIATVFGRVPVQSFQRACIEDLEWILTGDHILETPFYCVLNCCRVLAMRRDGWDRVLSKDEGGEWGLNNLPEPHRSVVAQAVACYRSPHAVSQELRRTDGHDWDLRALCTFRDYVAQCT